MPIAGKTPSRTHNSASTTCGNCIIQSTSRRPLPAACAATSALVRDRKLTPKNLMNEARVSALVKMATTATHRQIFCRSAALNGRHVDAPFADEAVEQRHPGDGKRRHQRRHRRQRHELHQAAHLVEVLGAGGVEHRAGIEEQQGLEQAMVEDVEQGAEKANRGERRSLGRLAGSSAMQTPVPSRM